VLAHEGGEPLHEALQELLRVVGGDAAIGGFGANHHLRQSLVFLNMPVLQQPEAYVSGIDKAFDASGKLVDDAKRDFLRKYLDAYAAWVERNPKPA
jgi:chromate reductase